MKHLKTCIAVSLDGFIARKDNDLDWIPENVGKEISATNELRNVLPVSYTHLDVYKRQEHIRSFFPRFQFPLCW